MHTLNTQSFEHVIMRDHTGICLGFTAKSNDPILAENHRNYDFRLQPKSRFFLLA